MNETFNYGVHLASLQNSNRVYICQWLNKSMGKSMGYYGTGGHPLMQKQLHWSVPYWNSAGESNNTHQSTGHSKHTGVHSNPDNTHHSDKGSQWCPCEWLKQVQPITACWSSHCSSIPLLPPWGASRQRRITPTDVWASQPTGKGTHAAGRMSTLSLGRTSLAAKVMSKQICSSYNAHILFPWKSANRKT